ncbi:MAG: hypothetical protein FJY88_10260 [Candidatus Eisenbacteria bacterium]|nr:hypothetical protein [Candidatus Eisenbacteria bacterium]
MTDKRREEMRDGRRGEMTENPLDPRLEKLVALLYGELSGDEERMLRRLIEEDDELRAHWEDLVASRSFLGTWDVTDQPPRFVFVDDDAGVESRPVAVPGRVGWAARLRGVLTATPWAVSVAACLVAVLAVSGFRVTRTDAGFAFGFERGQSPAARDGDLSRLDPASGPLASSRMGREGTLEPGGRASAQQADERVPYFTKEEFDAYSTGMIQAVVALLNDYARQRDQQVAGYLQASLGDVVDRQTEDYNELRSRIEALNVGLLEERLRSRSNIDRIVGSLGGGSAAQAVDSTITPGEGVIR